MSPNYLFLLKPTFYENGKGPYFCPSCAEIAGLLEFYPMLRHQMNIRYLDFARPRWELLSMLGEQNQSCPVLILAEVPEA
jgi:hypothetical protein